MDILMMKITIRNSFVTSLKEKRMIKNSIMQRLKNKFNVSVAEIEYQDNHKLLKIGIVGAFSNIKILSSSKEKIIDYIEGNIDGEIIEIEDVAEIF